MRHECPTHRGQSSRIAKLVDRNCPVSPASAASIQDWSHTSKATATRVLLLCLQGIPVWSVGESDRKAGGNALSEEGPGLKSDPPWHGCLPARQSKVCKFLLAKNNLRL